MKEKKYPTSQINTNSYRFHELGQEIFIAESYSFYSIGPKGKIELRIIFSKDQSQTKIEMFNLAFGVWNPASGEIDDTVETRNNDMDQILATVGEKALDFIIRNPNAYLYAQGSNPIRTRKYQMGISRNLADIPTNLGIYGIVADDSGSMEMENFRSGISYHAFLFYAK